MAFSSVRAAGRIAFAALLLLMPPLLFAGGPGGRAEYVGGTSAQVPRGSEGIISTVDSTDFTFRSDEKVVRVPYARINLLEYGQKVNRRYALGIILSPVLLLSKSRKHYLTLGYTDEAGEQHALVFQVHKNDVRPVLAALEARTGRRVEYQDDNARKAGKG